jgi:nicotinamide-nucleotide amidase
MIPEGSRAIPNPNGTAPGIAIEVSGDGNRICRLFALPGVPAEMKEMWEGSVSVALRETTGAARVIRRRKIKCFGAGESTIEAMLPDLVRRGRVPQVGINASKTTIILRITGEGATEEQCEAVIEPTAATIHRCLGNLVFGEGDDELQHAVIRLLQQQDRTLATFEWGTAGTVADWMGEVAEAQTGYLGGIIVTDEHGLTRAGGVPQKLLSRHSAISGEVARAMAAGCRERFGADYGLAVTPFPRFGPTVSEPEPVFAALAGPKGVDIKPIPFAGHPATLKIYCAKQALNMVRLALLESNSIA